MGERIVLLPIYAFDQDLIANLKVMRMRITWKHLRESLTEIGLSIQQCRVLYQFTSIPDVVRLKELRRHRRTHG